MRPRPRRLPPPLNLHLSRAEAQALLRHLEAVQARRAVLDADPVLRASGLPHPLGLWLTILTWYLQAQLVPEGQDAPGAAASGRPRAIDPVPRPGQGTPIVQNEPGVGRTGPAGAPEPVSAPASVGMPPPASRRDGAFLQNEPDPRPAGRAGVPGTATARVAPAAPRPGAAVLQNEPGRQEPTRQEPNRQDAGRQDAGRQEARRTVEGQPKERAPLAAATAGARSPAPRPGPPAGGDGPAGRGPVGSGPARSGAARAGPAGAAPVPPAPAGPAAPAQEVPQRRGCGTLEDPLIPQPVRHDPRLRGTGAVPTARIDHREPPLIVPPWWRAR